MMISWSGISNGKEITSSLGRISVAESAGGGEGACSIAKPNIHCFVTKLHLWLTRFFRSNILLSFDGSSNIFTTAQSLEHKDNIF